VFVKRIKLGLIMEARNTFIGMRDENVGLSAGYAGSDNAGFRFLAYDGSQVFQISDYL